MASKLWLFPLLLCTPLFAIDFQPWIPPLWEFQTEGGLFYVHQKDLSTAQGTQSDPGSILSCHGDLGLTFWPYWSMEVDVYFTRTSEIDFTYEAAFGQIKYQWYDDVAGDPFALVSGVLFFLPNTHFLDSTRFLYHGKFNVEVYSSIGKEWSCGSDWILHAWAVAGFGFANHGDPWFHVLGRWDFKITPCTTLNLFSEGIFSLGRHDLNLNVPFRGYANISHQTIDIGCRLERVQWNGTFSLSGWYNVYARNFFKNYWGLEIALYVPFSF